MSFNFKTRLLYGFWTDIAVEHS